MIEAAFQFILNLVRDHGPVVLFLAALIENAFFLSWALPGEALLAIGGYWIQQGQLRPEVAWLSVFAGVALGDHVGYLIGRIGGRRLVARMPARGAFQQVEKLIQKYGGAVVLFGRFSGWIRPVVLLAVGTLGLKYRTFWPYELLGAAAWSAWWLTIGVVGGMIFDRFGDLGHVRQYLMVASALAAAYLLWTYRERVKQFLQGDPEAGATPTGRT